MIRRATGICIVILGLFLVIGAAGLTLWNIHTDNSAGEVNREVLERIAEAIPPPAEEDEIAPAEDILPGIFTPDFTPQQVKEETPELEKVIVDGREYIGVLSIPRLGLELSILTECDDKTVDAAPGRWVGTPYREGFVIGGHNYRSHLGKIDRLREGDSITFTDLTGKVFSYEVVGQEILEAYQGDILADDEWGLSLFTCTLAGNRRIVVRCTSLDEKPKRT